MAESNASQEKYVEEMNRAQSSLWTISEKGAKYFGKLWAEIDGGEMHPSGKSIYHRPAALAREVILETLAEEGDIGTKSTILNSNEEFGYKQIDDLDIKKAFEYLVKHGYLIPADEVTKEFTKGEDAMRNLSYGVIGTQTSPQTRNEMEEIANANYHPGEDVSLN